jgi:hypothetical protein
MMRLRNTAYCGVICICVFLTVNLQYLSGKMDKRKKNLGCVFGSDFLEFRRIRNFLRK